jgi:hypothetical protein
MAEGSARNADPLARALAAAVREAFERKAEVAVYTPKPARRLVLVERSKDGGQAA